MDNSGDVYIDRIRDMGRPDFNAVRDVMQGAFERLDMGVVMTSSGPDTCVWEDTFGAEQGMHKFYVLSKSTQPGTEGYPLLTIRQAYSTKLDAWITFSSLIVGPDEIGINHTLSLVVAMHAGAYAGVKYVSAATFDAGGNATAGILSARDLINMKPESRIGVDTLAECERIIDDANKKKDLN